MEQGREIGFSSHNLPLSKSTIAFATEREDTESQYADELRRQAYIQTLGKLIQRVVCESLQNSIFNFLQIVKFSSFSFNIATPDLIKVKGSSSIITTRLQKNSQSNSHLPSQVTATTSRKSVPRSAIRTLPPPSTTPTTGWQSPNCRTTRGRSLRTCRT